MFSIFSKYFNLAALNTSENSEMPLRAAGFVIFRRICGQIEYLLLQASDGDKHWSPPKGHVDSGEDDFTTALRETKEESGYCESDLEIYKQTTKTLNYIARNKSKTVIYWLAELKDPNKEPILSEEHMDLKWLPKDEAKKLAYFKDFNDLIDFFHDTIK